MGKRFRRFLLAVTSVCPPLQKRLKRYFRSHPLYEFTFECATQDPYLVLGHYVADASVVELRLGNVMRHAESVQRRFFGKPASDEDLIQEIIDTINHEELHRVLSKVEARRDYISWFCWQFRALPFPERLIDIEERVVSRVTDVMGERCLIPWMAPKYTVEPDEGDEAASDLKEDAKLLGGALRRLL